MKMINEELSISSNVQKATNLILDDLKNEYQKANWNEVRYSYNNNFGIIPHTIINISVSKYNIGIINVSLELYNFNSYEDSQENDYRYNYGGELDSDLGEIRITWYSINKEVDFNSISLLLSHEITHLFQIMRSGNFPSKKLYRKVIVNQDDNNLSPEMQSLSSCIYWSYPFEINANSHKLYNELFSNNIENIDDAKKCDTFKELIYLGKVVKKMNEENLWENKYDTEYFLGKTYDSIKKMLNNGYKYAISKFSKAIQLYFNKKQRLNENFHFIKNKKHIKEIII